MEKGIIKPRRLEHGDKVAIISPSSIVVSDRELELGMDTLRSLGFDPVRSKNALKSRFNFQAGTPQQRLSDLHWAFSNRSIKGIFCSTGGYSSIDLLSNIDWGLIKKNPKIFVGYSDITTLLNPIHDRTGLITFHGPIIEGLNGMHKRQGKYTLQNMVKAISGGVEEKMPSYTEWRVLKKGVAEGALVGGNLNILMSLIGTPYEPKWDGKILFWEEVDDTIEGFYNYLIRMRIVGIFNKISGMMIGKITNLQSIDDEDENPKRFEHSPLVSKMILYATRGYKFPILYDVDFGHDVANLTLPIGVRARLECPVVDRVGSLALIEKYLR
ncbi:MAG: LD-carboxypeptidase [Patescibacteria group bacterium]